MKIALFVDQFPKVSETFILNQIDGLLDRGHEITIFPCQPGTESKVHDAVKRHRLIEKCHYPRNEACTLQEKIAFYIGLIKLKLKYAEAVSRLRGNFGRYSGIANWQWALTKSEPVLRHGGRFDVLFAHFGPNGLRASWYRDAGLIDGPLVAVFHGFDLSSYLRIADEHVYDRLFSNGDLFLPISRFWQNKLQALGCPAEKLEVHHVGIDCDQFVFQSRTRTVDEPTVLISVARLVEKKGIEYAIRALARPDVLNLNVHYRIIGDGPLSASLRQLVTDMRLQDRVSFLGTKTSEEVASELSHAHLFIAPSVTSESGDMEGIPTVLMEAMATGLPVISTLHSGIAELVDDGVSGKLVAERDVAGLAEAIRELTVNVDSWPVIGAAGREKVLREFNSSTLNSRLEHLFESAVQGRTSP
ncbi:MAG TPA: colanic acid biosynthesis glycosyltransferase WcaL [Gammaproteobacteria bacterium]|nr:colanic acid biosynthesis glycosyltransferase WcaL [Gammaproteobacteria bacterium]